MLGIGSYATSSPKFMLALLVISAAVVTVIQFSPLFKNPAPGANAQLVTTTDINNPLYAALFETPRSVPADNSRTSSQSAEVSAPGFSSPSDPVDQDVIAEIPVIVPVDPSQATGGTQRDLALRPTFSWANVFSDSSTVNGVPVQVGDVVTAFDPEGTLVGHFTVIREGQFGLMALYEDDPATSVDEGAVVGDEIRFEINGLPTVVLGPHEPIWTANGALLMLNMAAAQSSS